MCDIPLDLQRKFEQRWAARFSRPADAVEKPTELSPRKESPTTEGMVQGSGASSSG
jgi:hypothetical protein